MVTFSIITANFNSRNKLFATAASVIEQRADLEYLIIDGASSDESLDHARGLAEREQGRVRLVSESDGGVFDAMNKGVRLARGRYILFLGAGDLLFPGVLSEVTPHLPDHDVGFVYGNVMYLGRRCAGPFNYRKLYRQNICQQAIFYGRGVFHMCGQFDTRYVGWADWEFNLRCFGRRQVAKQYVPMPIASFEEGGISCRDDLAFVRDKDCLIRRHLGRWRYWQFRALLVECRLRASVRRFVGRVPGATRVKGASSHVIDE